MLGLFLPYLFALVFFIFFPPDQLVTKDLDTVVPAGITLFNSPPNFTERFGWFVVFVHVFEML